MDVTDEKVLVVGAGASGVSAALLLARKGARVTINDLRTRAELGADASRLERAGVELALEGHAEAVFEEAELVVVSPGVPPLPIFREVEARGVEVISEVELAARFLAAPLVGITGTNGKSTVTTLIGEMMKRSGKPTFVGGNLGVALSDAVDGDADRPDGVAVVELSSFQLERVRVMKPIVALLLNVSPDHLDRYPSVDAYGRAKANIFSAQGPTEHAVLPAGDATVAAFAPPRDGATRHWYGGSDGEVRVDGDAIVDTETGWRFPLSELRLQGLHNQLNACAAVLAARLAGASGEAITETLREVGGLPHRAELVRTVDGVDWVDDSKATNVGAALAALEGLASPTRLAVLIAGGVDKGGSYVPLAQRFYEVGRAVVLMGEAAPLLADAFAGLGLPIENADSMAEAVARARALARPGDVVLLAPACSSFDMFRSYAHRGDVFQDAVRALDEGGAS
ncbi:MAG: UDP-N-acetylmuramoyl-L-alanine--D-glutamate ligase [Sandaracinaceae bacterium]|nr:UDP-N-acetylmuramoyl-L-alanine--D-glutamate ligase [Sandaracinaceae bacterium]